MGCKTQVQRKQVESHLQSAVSLHLDLACVKLNETEVKLNNTEVKLNATEEKTRELMKKFDALQRQLIGTQKALDNTKKQVMKFDTKQAQFSLELNSTKVKLNNTDVKFNDMQEKLETARKQVEKLDKPFVWKINNFSSLLKQAKAGEATYMFSDSTELCGYKLRVLIYPNGNGSGKNTHLSAYMYIVKGEYDAILPWPFIKKVTFTLIDQQEDPAKRENVTNQFTPGNSPECFARPTQEFNVGQGFDQFTSHDNLHSRCYLVDDTLFLKVEIGP